MQRENGNDGTAAGRRSLPRTVSYVELLTYTNGKSGERRKKEGGRENEKSKRSGERTKTLKRTRGGWNVREASNFFFDNCLPGRKCSLHRQRECRAINFGQISSNTHTNSFFLPFFFNSFILLCYLSFRLNFVYYFICYYLLLFHYYLIIYFTIILYYFYFVIYHLVELLFDYFFLYYFIYYSLLLFYYYLIIYYFNIILCYFYFVIYHLVELLFDYFFISLYLSTSCLADLLRCKLFEIILNLTSELFLNHFFLTSLTFFQCFATSQLFDRNYCKFEIHISAFVSFLIVLFSISSADSFSVRSSKT